jgi:hypothetical protein
MFSIAAARDLGRKIFPSRSLFDHSYLITSSARAVQGRRQLLPKAAIATSRVVGDARGDALAEAFRRGLSR